MTNILMFTKVWFGGHVTSIAQIARDTVEEPAEKYNSINTTYLQEDHFFSLCQIVFSQVDQICLGKVRAVQRKCDGSLAPNFVKPDSCKWWN